MRAARAAAKPAAQPVAQPVPKPAVQPMAQDHSKLLSLHVYAVAVGASTVWYRSSARWSTLCPSRLGGTVASVTVWCVVTAAQWACQWALGVTGQWRTVPHTSGIFWADDRFR